MFGPPTHASRAQKSGNTRVTRQATPQHSATDHLTKIATLLRIKQRISALSHGVTNHLIYNLPFFENGHKYSVISTELLETCSMSPGITSACLRRQENSGDEMQAFVVAGMSFSGHRCNPPRVARCSGSEA